METDWEYACFKGDVMIGGSGSRGHAEAIKEYRIARYGENSRFDYVVKRRRVCKYTWREV